MKFLTLFITCLLIVSSLAQTGGKKHQTKDPKQKHKCNGSHMSKYICQNFHTETEKKINSQIKEELKASYFYQGLSFHFARDNVALHGFAKYFKKASDEERHHAEIFMEYLNKRGGQIKLHDIPKPTLGAVTSAANSYDKVFNALKRSLELEKEVNAHLFDLHDVADSNNDYQFTDIIDGVFLKEQVESMKEFGDLLSKAERFKREKSSVGIHILDQELLKD